MNVWEIILRALMCLSSLVNSTPHPVPQCFLKGTSAYGVEAKVVDHQLYIGDRLYEPDLEAHCLQWSATGQHLAVAFAPQTDAEQALTIIYLAMPDSDSGETVVASMKSMPLPISSWVGVNQATDYLRLQSLDQIEIWKFVGLQAELVVFANLSEAVFSQGGLMMAALRQTENMHGTINWIGIYDVTGPGELLYEQAWTYGELRLLAFRNLTIYAWNGEEFLKLPLPR